MSYVAGKNKELIIGRLCDEGGGIDPIHDTRAGDIYYNVMPMQALPVHYDTYIEYFEAGVNSLSRYGLDWADFGGDYVSFERAVYDLLYDKLILFYPYKGGSDHNNVDFTSVELVPRPAGYSDDMEYTPVPVFSKNDTGSDEAKFARALRRGEGLYVGRPIPIDEHDMPPFVLWQTEDDVYHAYGPIAAIGGTSESLELRVAEGYSVVEVEPKYVLSFVVSEHSGLAYLNRQAVEQIKMQLQFAEAAVVDDPASEEDTLAGSLDPELRARLAAIQERAPEHVAAPVVADRSATPARGVVTAENAFIAQVAAVARAEGYGYASLDIINFHVALKSSRLTVLAGMSGTGKSQLVRLYAKALGASAVLKSIAVRPSWTDDADILGYLDMRAMAYRPADSGLVDTLIEAAKNPDKCYIVCFDEMNLSRVEHYFSQFISILERPAGERTLELYNAALEEQVRAASTTGENAPGSAEAFYPAHITIGDNVRFVGTVNIDESTFDFSDKLLDRATILRLHPLTLKELAAMLESAPAMPTLAPYSLLEFCEPCGRELELAATEIALLDELSARLTEARAGLGVGFRIARQIASYLASVPEGSGLSRGEALDMELAQRVLTKVRGQQAELGELLTPGEGSLAAILDRYKTLSDFAECRAVLARKEKEMMSYGYTV